MIEATPPIAPVLTGERRQAAEAVCRIGVAPALALGPFFNGEKRWPRVKSYLALRGDNHGDE